MKLKWKLKWKWEENENWKWKWENENVVMTCTMIWKSKRLENIGKTGFFIFKENSILYGIFGIIKLIFSFLR